MEEKRARGDSIPHHNNSEHGLRHILCTFFANAALTPKIPRKIFLSTHSNTHTPSHSNREQHSPYLPRLSVTHSKLYHQAM